MAHSLPFSLTLLFGIPATHAEYLDAAAQPRRSDYLRPVFEDMRSASARSANADAAFAQAVDRFWINEYAAVCEAAGELAETATALGGRVVFGARLSDLADATAASDAVVVLTHWKSERVARRDFKWDSAGFVEDVTRSKAPVARMLRGWRGGNWRREVQRAPDEDARGRIIEAALNDLIASGKLLKTIRAYDKSMREELGGALSRDVLDETFPLQLESGNRLELFDGWHPPGVVASACARNFNGELDLSACQSIVLARALRGAFGTRARIICNLDALLPLPRYRVLTETLRLAAARQQPYYAARADVDRALSEQLTSKKRK